jgi:membrane protein YqaA with SNARE-associated domain
MRLLLSFVLVNPVWTWLQRLGGPGLIALGLADNSAIPLPGSMDLLVILLSAQQPLWWPYYAFMATVGALIGGYLTYRLAEKGGEDVLEKRIGKRRADKVYRRFKAHGFSTVAVGAILPPPFPIVPFLLAAGALKYPRRNFLAALALGRATRFVTLAYLAHRYGSGIIGWVSRYYRPLLYTLISLAVTGGIAGLLYWKWYLPKHPSKQGNPKRSNVTELTLPSQPIAKRKRAR